MSSQSPPLDPFKDHGARSSARLAFEPSEGAWGELRAGPVLDLPRLLARPWRDRPDDASMPGSILVQPFGGSAEHDLSLCSLNMTLAVRLAMGAQGNPGAAAFDAGCCWISTPPTTSRGAFHFLRKDGAARETALRGGSFFPQDQETRWTISELEAASASAWIMCLATAEALSLDWEGNPMMSQAASELRAAFNQAALDEATPGAKGRGVGKRAL